MDAFADPNFYAMVLIPCFLPTILALVGLAIQGRRRITIPYSRRRCARIYWNRGFHCQRYGLSLSHDYGIPHAAIYLGPYGYIEVFPSAIR